MKKTILDKWCGQPWLHATYYLGIVMANVLIINWSVWSVPQKLMGLLTAVLPLHHLSSAGCFLILGLWVK